MRHTSSSNFPAGNCCWESIYIYNIDSNLVYHVVFCMRAGKSGLMRIDCDVDIDKPYLKKLILNLPPCCNLGLIESLSHEMLFSLFFSRAVRQQQRQRLSLNKHFRHLSGVYPNASLRGYAATSMLGRHFWHIRGTSLENHRSLKCTRYYSTSKYSVSLRIISLNF